MAVSHTLKVDQEPKKQHRKINSSATSTKKSQDISTKKPQVDVSKIPKLTSKYTNMALSLVKGESQ